MKLSIITINYNNKIGLQKTIDSVMSQVWRDFEWIIIDGGSTDGSKQIIENVVNDVDSNISFWCSEKDNGVYNAMNKGIAHAKGVYLNFMNSGDVFFDSCTLKNVFSKEYTVDIIYGDWKCVWNDHEAIRTFPYPIEIYSFYKRNICHQSMFILRAFHLMHLYDESYSILADHKNWILAALCNAKFEYVPLCICSVTMDGISCSGNEKVKQECEKLRNDLWKSPIGLSLEKLDKQLNDPYQLRVRTLLGMGGIPKFITLCFLKIMKNLYLRDIDESWK